MFPISFMITKIIKSVFSRKKQSVVSRRFVGEFVHGNMRARLVEQRETLGPPKYWIDVDILSSNDQWQSFGTMTSDELPRQLAMLRQHADYVSASVAAR